jgi:hypothetical protein
MQSKKKVHIQQFGIIHLPNPDLTYIRNPERNKIMSVPFHLLQNLYQESFSILYFFFTLPPRGKHDGNHDPRAHICAWGGEFYQVSIFTKLVCQTVGGQFFLFCQNYMDAKLICQTVGVALTNARTPNFRGGKSEYFFETLLGVGVPFVWILRGGVLT